MYNSTDSVTSMLQSLHWPTLEVRRKLFLLGSVIIDLALPSLPHIN